jgi:small subunit ribosomal protein S2
VSTISVSALLEAGVHFGHRVSRWNPKMAPYIFGKRNTIHIINLKETLRGLIRACHFLKRIAAENEKVLIVGTKRPAKNVVMVEAKKNNMPFVIDRWIGGTLTNYGIIRNRLKRLEEVERMEADGTTARLPKKELSALMREKRKLRRNLDGLREMTKLPAAVIVVDPRREKNAVKEARRLGIPTIAIIDTDSDPDTVDVPIPANDDAMRSIQVLAEKMTEAVAEGMAFAKERAVAEEKARGDREPRHAGVGGSDRRRTVVIRKAPVGPDAGGTAGEAAAGATT